MRWGFNKTLVVAAASLLSLVFGASCARDCDVICGKLEYCQQLPDISRNLCIDRCKDRRDESNKRTQTCADCLDGASCKSISRGSCGEICEEVLGDRVEQGAGGAGGAEEGGAGGEGGEGGDGSGGTAPE